LAKPSTELFQIALLGGETLLGGELKEVFEAQLKDTFVNAYAATGEGTFGDKDGEAVYLDAFDSKAVQSSRAVVAAGAAAGALKAYSLAKAHNGKVALIDCVGHLEQEPEARIVAPIPGDPNPPGAWLLVTAQPAAAAIAQTLRRLTLWHPIARSVVNIFEPASERGKAGAAELHQQTTSLLVFKGLDKDIFDAQAGFNLLPRYGPAAPFKLLAAERRIERHIAVLLGENKKARTAPVPSIRLIQVPVFHAYSISFWIEFAEDIAVSELGQALATAQIEVREDSQDVPNSIGAAGHSGLIAGDIRPDKNNPRAAWLWVVCDNLRMTADAAVTLLRSIKAPKS
jgi:aspartate-semialdehyde dehydrogenase